MSEWDMDAYAERERKEHETIIAALGSAMKESGACRGTAEWGAGSFEAKVVLENINGKGEIVVSAGREKEEE